MRIPREYRFDLDADIARTERVASGLYIAHGTNGRQVEIDRQDDGQWRVTGFNFSTETTRKATKRLAKYAALVMIQVGS